MTIRVNVRAGSVQRIALLSAILSSGIADAQIATGGLSIGTGLFGSSDASNAERAAPYTYGIDAGIGETDNVTLAPTNRISQTIATLDADLSVNERSRLFDVTAAGNFSYLDYLQNAYGNQLLGRFDGQADAAIIPGRLVWVLRDDFGQAALDAYTPLTPNNIENINYVTTGPDLRLRLGGVDFIDVSARYARAQYQTSPFNSNRLLGNVALGRDVSAGASISLNASTERVLFDNTVLNTDFERSSGYGRYELHGSRTDFVGELGATVVSQSGNSQALLPAGTVEPAPAGPAPGPAGSVPGLPGYSTQTGGSGSVSGPLAKLELSRAISPSSKIVIRAGRDLVDASSSFSSQSTGAAGINPITPAAQTSESYRTTYASVGWQYKRSRTTLAVTARWEQDVYPGLSTLDVRLPGADIRVERRLTRVFTLQLVDSWYKSNYPHASLSPEVNGSTDTANNILGGSLICRLGRGLEIRLRAEHDTYSVSNGNTGYHETRGFLTVGYRPTLNPAREDLTEP